MSDAEYIFKHALTQEVSYNSAAVYTRARILAEHAGSTQESVNVFRGLWGVTIVRGENKRGAHSG